jgi:glycosyltransferase involved in cell wall biosynthesis
MSSPAVSVVVSSYNYGRYVGGALASVRAQTFADFEALVIDDSSSDDSLAAIEPFLADPRFRLVRQRHLGQTRTKNRGLELARAPFIAFLDADDTWAPDKLERQVAKFRAEPGLGVVFTRRTLIDAAGAARPCLAAAPPVGRVVNELFRQNFICFSSALLRAEVAAHVGGFDERLGLAIDYDFWLRAARHYPFGVVDAPLVAYRVGHVNLSRRQFDRLHVALLIMQRFERQYDVPAQLRLAGVSVAEAETFTHLGVISRGYSRHAALGWLLRSLRADPFYGPAWRGLVAATVPDGLRRLVRRVRGSSGAWERLCYSPFNRPESVL